MYELQQALEELLGRPLSPVPGYDTRALIAAADAGAVDTLLCLGGNLWGANPDSAEAKRALSRIDTIVYLATKPNQGHFHGLAASNTLVLPVFNRFETPHRTTTESGNNFVRLNEPGSTHLKGADLISEVAFLAELAMRLMGTDPIDWGRLQDASYVRELIGRTVPGYGRSPKSMPAARNSALKADYSTNRRLPPPAAGRGWKSPPCRCCSCRIRSTSAAWRRMKPDWCWP